VASPASVRWITASTWSTVAAVELVNSFTSGRQA
jgi:hypothetical protein